jgi:branched-subunit amino acid aminotransferase/4-amino-4-deoxychorismate lyase
MIFDYVIFNGDLLPAREAQVFIFHNAYFSSFGVYETVKIDQGRPFYLDEHLHRLHHSARMLDLELGVEVPILRQWFDKLIAVDPEATWSLKIIALGPDQAGDSPIIAMQSTALPTYPDTFYENGASAVLFAGRRLLPACKSLNTLVNFLARRAASRSGVLEGLLHHDGHLTEGSRTNLFAVRQGHLITPPTNTVLSGITREVIIEAMQGSDHPVSEQSLPADPDQFDEFFISSTSMHVMPITRLDDRPVGNGQVGPITKVAMARFETAYRRYMEAQA